FQGCSSRGSVGVPPLAAAALRTAGSSKFAGAAQSRVLCTYTVVACAFAARARCLSLVRACFDFRVVGVHWIWAAAEEASATAMIEQPSRRILFSGVIAGKDTL